MKPSFIALIATAISASAFAGSSISSRPSTPTVTYKASPSVYTSSTVSASKPAYTAPATSSYPTATRTETMSVSTSYKTNGASATPALKATTTTVTYDKPYIYKSPGASMAPDTPAETRRVTTIYRQATDRYVSRSTAAPGSINTYRTYAASRSADNSALETLMRYYIISRVLSGPRIVYVRGVPVVQRIDPSTITDPEARALFERMKLEGEPAAGDFYKIPANMMVTMKGMGGEGSDLRCFVSYHGVLEVVDVDKSADPAVARVKYSSPSEDRGTDDCPSGKSYNVPLDELAGYNAQFLASLQRDLVLSSSDALADETVSEPVPVRAEESVGYIASIWNKLWGSSTPKTGALVESHSSENKHLPAKLDDKKAEHEPADYFDKAHDAQ